MFPLIEEIREIMSVNTVEMTSIPVTKDVWEDAKILKTGGESWDSLVRKMVDDYDPSDYPSGEYLENDQ